MKSFGGGSGLRRWRRSARLGHLRSNASIGAAGIGRSGEDGMRRSRQGNRVQGSPWNGCSAGRQGAEVSHTGASRLDHGASNGYRDVHALCCRAGTRMTSRLLAPTSAPLCHKSYVSEPGPRDEQRLLPRYSPPSDICHKPYVPEPGPPNGRDKAQDGRPSTLITRFTYSARLPQRTGCAIEMAPERNLCHWSKCCQISSLWLARTSSG